MLPNDKNSILAAQQAAGLTHKRLHVVPTRSMAQGLAALLAVNPEDSIESAIEAAEEARTSVRTVEITRAVRNTTIKGVKVGRGEAIAIVDGELTLGADSTEDAVLDALRDVATAETSLITLYYGASTGESQAASLAVKLRDRFPAHEVEVVYGGQPHYPLLVSAE